MTASSSGIARSDSLAPPPVFAAHPFDRPNDRPGDSPVHGVGRVVRPLVGPTDIGAYEFGSGPPPIDGGPHDVDGGAVLPGSDGGPSAGLDAGPSTARDAGPTAPPADGCGCRAAARSSSAPVIALLLLAAALVLRRR